MMSAAHELGVTIGARQQEQLDGYLDLLIKWNRVYNLTAIHDRGRMVTHHILDSLSVIPSLGDGSVVDLGSGAGLPGVVIALLVPTREVVMVDSNIKKVRFIQQAILELGLDNASVVHSRVEQFEPEQPFNIAVSRAFTSLNHLLQASAPLLTAGGRVIAMKGKWPEERGGEVIEGFWLERIVPLAVPGIDAERHLVICRKG